MRRFTFSNRDQSKSVLCVYVCECLAFALALLSLSLPVYLPITLSYLSFYHLRSFYSNISFTYLSANVFALPHSFSFFVCVCVCVCACVCNLTTSTNPTMKYKRIKFSPHTHTHTRAQPRTHPPTHPPTHLRSHLHTHTRTHRMPRSLLTWLACVLLVSGVGALASAAASSRLPLASLQEHVSAGIHRGAPGMTNLLDARTRVEKSKAESESCGNSLGTHLAAFLVAAPKSTNQGSDAHRASAICMSRSRVRAVPCHALRDHRRSALMAAAQDATSTDAPQQE
jgi:hypothetical protein